MKTLVFKGPLLGKSRRLRDRIDEYLVYIDRFYHVPVINSITWISHGEDYAELIVVLKEGYWKTVVDGIEDLQVQERLALVEDYLLKRLAWKFSSPALTQAFRDAILSLSPGTTNSPRLKT